MPRRLPDRCGPDCIRGFGAAARQRASEAEILARNERRTCAVYLWGYSAEMTLKAAYFRLIGFAPDQPITRDDLKIAASGAAAVMVHWPNPNRLHDLGLWGELLVNTRLSRSTWRYPSTRFGSRVLSLSLQLQRNWRETLRYHKNVAYAHGVRTVREAAGWLLANSPSL